MDGSPPVRLGDGTGYSISPDGSWVAAVAGIVTGGKLVLLPTGAGQPKPLPLEGLKVSASDFLPDGKRILVTAAESGHGPRLFLLDLESGKARPISPEGYQALGGTISRDGRRVVVIGPDRRDYLYPIEGGEPAAIPGLAPLEAPLGWTEDGKALYVYMRGDYPARVSRLDVASGQREFWKELTPPDPAGISTISPPRMTPDGKSYVYSYNRILSDLFLAEGIK